MPGIRRAVTEIVAAMLGRHHSLPALEQEPAPAGLGPALVQPGGPVAVKAKARPPRKRIALVAELAQPVGIEEAGDDDEEVPELIVYLTAEPHVGDPTLWSEYALIMAYMLGEGHPRLPQHGHFGH